MSIPKSNQILDQVVLVTGAASGIGLEVSAQLIKAGRRVVLLDSNATELNVVSARLGSRAICVPVDVRDTDIVIATLMNLLDPNREEISGFVHAAGVSALVPLRNVSRDRALEVFEVNALSALLLTKTLFSKRAKMNSRRSVVFISSIYGLVGSPANTMYAASKASLHGLTKSLALELAPSNTTVNCVAPGFVDTPMLQVNLAKFPEGYLDGITRLHPLGLGRTEDVAAAILFLLSEGARWITGAVIPVDGGYSAQ